MRKKQFNLPKLNLPRDVIQRDVLQMAVKQALSHYHRAILHV